MKRAVLGFSGGLDSTAAAIILREEGYEISALYIEIPGSEAAGRAKAEEIAELLGFPLAFRDASSIFEKEVLRRFRKDYSEGRTPNPCVFCNPAVKFRLLADFADEIGTERIATGHYARVMVHDGFHYIYKARDGNKDQSYMLSRLGQDFLRRTFFPAGEANSKEELRALVKSFGLPCADEGESQDICFIPDGDYRAFLKASGFKEVQGKFINKNGKVLGRHKGFWNFTIGQRKGLGIAVGKPVFVSAIDAAENSVILGPEEELYKCSVRIGELHFAKYGSCACLPGEYDGIEVSAKLRYTKGEDRCRLRALPGGGAELNFENPVRAPASGQAAVLYDGERLIAGGIIDQPCLLKQLEITYNEPVK